MSTEKTKKMQAIHRLIKSKRVGKLGVSPLHFYNNFGEEFIVEWNDKDEVVTKDRYYELVEMFPDVMMSGTFANDQDAELEEVDKRMSEIKSRYDSDEPCRVRGFNMILPEGTERKPFWPTKRMRAKLSETSLMPS